MKRLFLVFLVCLCICPFGAYSQGIDCNDSEAFCTSGGPMTFPASTSTTAPPGPNYGCLGSQPNPAWFFLEIATAGNIVLDLYNSASVDIDFICWGPFTSQAAGCASGLTGSAVDCSFSGAATETCTITGALPGEVYILLITNYSGMPTNISFDENPTGTTGTTDCTILCSINSLTAIPGPCSSATGTYDLTGSVAFTDPPVTGTLTISNSCTGATQVFSAPFTSPYAYTLTGLPADGAPCTVTATFSADPTCTLTQTFTAPPPCAVFCSISAITATPGACDPATILYDVSGSVTFANPPSTGTLTITNSCGGTPFVINAPFGSPEVYTITGLNSDGLPCTITAVFSDSTACTNTQTYTAPVSCSPCPVTAANNGPLCPGDSLYLSVTPTIAGATYTWNGPAGFSTSTQNPSISSVSLGMSGTYTVSVSVASPPCSATATTTVVVNPNPTIGTSGDVSIYDGATASINATGGVSYSWNPTTNLSCPTCDTTLANPSVTTPYCVTVTNASGCVDSSCLTVYIVPPCESNRNMIVPNAFTPNNDGVNDKLCLFGWDNCITFFQIMIYDRWGTKIFETKDPAFCWDGYYKGKLMDPAVFIYFIKATYEVDGANPLTKESKDITKTGNITLVR